jgi:hypothetical protein
MQGSLVSIEATPCFSLAAGFFPLSPGATQVLPGLWSVAGILPGKMHLVHNPVVGKRVDSAKLSALFLCSIESGFFAHLEFEFALFLLAEHDPGGEQHANSHNQDDDCRERVDIWAKPQANA